MQSYNKIEGVLIVLIFVLVFIAAVSKFTYAQYSPYLHDKTLYEITKQKSTQIPHITVGAFPSAIGFDSFTDKIYVANAATNTVSVIDGFNNTKIGKDIPVREDPADIGVVYDTHRIYVANMGNNTVSVIDGKSNTNIKNITVGKAPFAIGVDNIREKIYVSDTNNTVSVIDGKSNTNIKNIQLPVGKGTGAIYVDEYTNKIYVAVGNNTVSVINGTTYHVETIPVGTDPAAINGFGEGTGADGFTDKVYVANKGNNSVSVIDGKSNTNIKNITVGAYPSNIAVDGDKIYVANVGSSTVSVIYGKNNTKIPKDIPVGNGPSAIDVDDLDHVVYVANDISNTVSVIDGKSNTNIKNITVGKDPLGIAFDGDTKTIYVSNAEDNSVSLIDGEANKVVARVMFNIEPFNSGHIECDDATDKGKWNAPLKQQYYVYSGSGCTAIPYPSFEFVSWQENLGKNSTQFINATAKPSILDPILNVFGFNPDKPESKLSITKFGNFTASFRPLPPPIPPEYVATLFTVVATAFIGTWLTPALIGWRKTRTQRKYFKECIYQIGKLDKNAIDNKIIGYYADGKLSDVHHQLLNDKISEYYEEKGSDRYSH